MPSTKYNAFATFRSEPTRICAQHLMTSAFDITLTIVDDVLITYMMRTNEATKLTARSQLQHDVFPSIGANNDQSPRHLLRTFLHPLAESPRQSTSTRPRRGTQIHLPRRATPFRD